jgi:hypothetical protein
MYHRDYTTYLHKELDFLKSLVSRFHEQNKINDLELNVALQKTQDVYEQFLRIKLLPNADLIEKPTSFKPKVDKPLPIVTIEEKVAEQTEQPKAAPLLKKQSHEPEFVVITAPEEVIVVKEAKTVQKEEPVINIREEKPQQTTTPKVSILAEKLSPTESVHINETLAQQKAGNDLSSKLQTSPLSSIASGIGINDKFLYIRELFSGDSDMYNRTVKSLDNAYSLEDALESIKTYFDWNEKDETVQKFVNLVYRRYA